MTDYCGRILHNWDFSVSLQTELSKLIPMEMITLIIILAIVSVLLFAVEIFITPGIGAAGITGTICVVVANALTFVYYGTQTGFIVLGVTLLVVCLTCYALYKSRALERSALHAQIKSTAATAAQLSVVPGEKGIATTRLALIGNAMIDNKPVEVKSVDGFIEEGTPIEVTSVNDALILVRKA